MLRGSYHGPRGCPIMMDASYYLFIYLC